MGEPTPSPSQEEGNKKEGSPPLAPPKRRGTKKKEDSHPLSLFSPRAIFETTDDRLTFLVTIPVHEGCDQSSGTSSGTNPKSSEKSTSGSEKSSEKILDLIKNKPTISAAEIAMEIDMSARGVEKQIRKLREAGIIKRIGADRGVMSGTCLLAS